MLFGGQGGEGVDLDGVGVDDGEGEAVGSEGEVLAGAFDGGALGAEDLFAGVGLVDDDGLGLDLVGADGLVGDEGGVGEDAAEGEASTGGGEDEGGGEVVSVEVLLPHLFTAHIEAAEDVEALAFVTGEGDELAVADEEGGWGAGGVERGELVDLAGVRVEVEGEVLAALVDDGEIAGGGGGDHAGGSGDDAAGGFGDHGVVLPEETVEVDLDGSAVGFAFDESGLAGGGERVDRLGRGWGAFAGFDDEEVGVGREEDGGDGAVDGVEELALGEGLAGDEVGEGREEGEGVADAEDELAVAKAPEVLAVIVQAPGGAGEDVA